jgi:hypothetical protein
MGIHSLLQGYLYFYLFYWSEGRNVFSQKIFSFQPGDALFHLRLFICQQPLVAQTRMLRCLLNDELKMMWKAAVVAHTMILTHYSP